MYIVHITHSASACEEVQVHIQDNTHTEPITHYTLRIRYNLLQQLQPFIPTLICIHIHITYGYSM